PPDRGRGGLRRAGAGGGLVGVPVRLYGGAGCHHLRLCGYRGEISRKRSQANGLGPFYLLSCFRQENGTVPELDVVDPLQRDRDIKGRDAVEIIPASRSI